MLHRIKQRVKHGIFTTITKVAGDGDEHVVLPTLSGPAKGLRFRLNLNEFGEPPYFYGTYELSEAKVIARLCQPGWVVWDCGIYLGYYTNLFSRLVGPQGSVVAFEPDPKNIERTRSNLALNKLSNVRFVHTAIGAPVGEVDFALSNNTNSHVKGAYIGTDRSDYATRERIDELIRVRCISLDEAYETPEIPRPNLIKIDIEGAELVALRHLNKVTTELRPIIILELHNPECDAAAWEFSQKARYSLQSLDRGEPIKSRADVGGTLLCMPLA